MSMLMLDTNTASYAIKGVKAITGQLTRTDMAVSISSITQAELLHGVAKRPEAKQLPIAVNAFLDHVNILPWDSEAAIAYASFKTKCERAGKGLGVMDMLIAAHSIAVNACLITSDKAFFQMKKHLNLRDWTK